MFGQGITGSSKNVPQWIMDLVYVVEADMGFCTDGIYFKECKKPDGRWGCYYSGKKVIDLYFGREKTAERVWVVLHELVHAWQHLECPETITKKPKHRKNNITHNQAFFECAAIFFLRYGGQEVLEYAANNEYKRGRKYMVAPEDYMVMPREKHRSL
jgi:Zn-dependent peptidase ImmA (M78 family)